MEENVSCGIEVQNEMRAAERALHQAIPEMYRAHGRLQAAAFGPGAVDRKTKELIALAIAVGKQCDGCIAAHARRAARRGAVSAEVAEAVGVAIAMNGGPAMVYGPRALAAFEEFAGLAPDDQTIPEDSR
jgi:AhpD family alkylhydroperoxidase